MSSGNLFVHRRQPDQFDKNEVYVAVQSQLGINGVYDQGYLGQTYDWRYPLGSPENTRRVKAAQEVLPIQEALMRTWWTDAMVVRYVVFDVETGLPLLKQPRVNKLHGGLEWMESQGFAIYFRSLWTDFDLPEHRLWTPELEREFIEKIRQIPSFKDAYIYMTRRGFRVVHVLNEWLPIRLLEDIEKYRMHLFAKEGLTLGGQFIGPDMNCSDLTRVYRLPNIMLTPMEKDDNKKNIYGVPFRHTGKTFFDDAIQISASERFPVAYTETRGEVLARGGVDGWSPDEIPAANDSGTKAKKPRVQKVHRVISFESELIPAYMPIVDMMGQTLARHWHKTGFGWHRLFLCLSGAFMRGLQTTGGVMEEDLPTLIYEITLRAEAIVGATVSYADENRLVAENTARLWAEADNKSEARIRGLKTLMIEYPPDIANAFKHAMVHGAKVAKRDEGNINTKFLSIKEAEETIFVNVRGAFGVARTTAIRAQPGVGKSHHACRALADASRWHDKTGERGLRSFIAPDKNVVSIQHARLIEKFNATVKRFRGSLSVLNDKGLKECRFFEAGDGIAKGGLSIAFNFCNLKGNPCIYKSTCKAVGQFDGEEDAIVAVGNHALIPSLAKHVGTNGLGVIDEMAQLLQITSIPLEDLYEVLTEGCTHFAGNYTEAMKPALLALIKWIENAELSDETGIRKKKFEEAIGEMSGTFQPAELDPACRAAGLYKPEWQSNVEWYSRAIIDCVKNALGKNPRSTKPPARLESIRMARSERSSRLAKQMGETAATYQLIYDFITHRLFQNHLRGELWVTEKYIDGMDKRMLNITMANEPFVEFLDTHPSIVILDATVDLHVRTMETMLTRDDKRYVVHLVDIPVKDAEGVRIDREWMNIKCDRATMMVNGHPVWNTVMKFVNRAVNWVIEAPKTKHGEKSKAICLITFKVIADALRAARGDAAALQRFMATSILSDAHRKELFERMVTAMGRCEDARWEIGHYYGLRGMNDMQYFDTFITIGDPWAPVMNVMAELSFLGLDEDPMKRNEELAEAELEQAHQRARDVRRTTFARHLAIGAICPRGYGWDSTIDVTVPDTTNVGIGSTMDGVMVLAAREELGYTQTEFASRIGVLTRTIQYIESGKRRPTPAICRTIERLLKTARAAAVSEGTH